MSSPAGSLVVVTGGSSGIGLAAAVEFARRGRPVLALSRDPGEAAAAGVETAAADVTDPAALAAAIGAAEERHGATACLVNSAGFLDAREFEQVGPEDFRREIETDLIGAMNATKVVLDGMLAAGAGTVINISSVSDRKAAPVALAYTTAKYGLRAFGESLRLAYGPRGLRVVNVAPGYVRTNIHAGMGISFEEYSERLGNPDFMSAEQLAEAIVWCDSLPPEICVRDIEITPTRTSF